MNADERRQWDDYVTWARERIVQPMVESAVVMTLVPGADVDVKIALEIGAAVLLDKPILAVVLPGRAISGHLARVADLVVKADIDTEAGREQLQLAISEFLADRAGS